MSLTRQKLKNKLVELLRLANTFLAISEKKSGTYSTKTKKSETSLEKDYLKALSKKLESSLTHLNQSDEKEEDFSSEELIVFLQDIIDMELAERAQCDIGARFSVLQSQLQKLLIDYREEMREFSSVEMINSQLKKEEAQEDETIVYVYLFNAQGRRLNSWLQFLSPQSLMDMSVNRPIYAKKEHVDELLRSKTDTDLHAYIKVVVKKANILMPLEESVLKDSLGNLLLRVKHAAIKQDKILGFYHQGKEYTFSKDVGFLPSPASFNELSN